LQQAEGSPDVLRAHRGQGSQRVGREYLTRGKNWCSRRHDRCRGPMVRSRATRSQAAFSRTFPRPRMNHARAKCGANMPRKSLALSPRTDYETFTISVPTLLDSTLGRITKESCDDRLESWSAKVIEHTGMSLDVRGREHAAPGQTYVVMSNH